MSTAYVVSSTGSVRSFRNATLAAAVAAHLGADKNFVATDKDLSKIPTPVLVLMHNEVRPEKPVQRFADRKTAEKRLSGVLEVLAKPGTVPEGVSAPAARSGSKGGGERPGRTASFAGKVIRKLVDKNPCREGTKRFDNWSKIREGMSYESYISGGGSGLDLRAHVAMKHVKLESA